MEKRTPNCACEVCGTRVYRRPWEQREYQRVFCSRKCYSAGIRSPLVKCSVCAQTFRPAKPTQKFCSRSCANVSRRGISYGARAQNGSQLRLATLRRAFDFRCCMVRGCTYDRTFDIHRFVAGKDGGGYEIGNMFAICPNHHAEASRGIITLQKISDCELVEVK